MANFRIVKATIEDDERVTKFIDEAFVKHEPLSLSLEMTPGNWPDDDEDDKGPLSEGMSLLAVSLGEDGVEEGKILGLSLNCEMSRDGANILENKAINSTEPKSAKILKFLSAMDRQANIWDKFNLEKAMGIVVLAVDNAVTGQGIGKTLMERSREVAIESGFPLLRVDCTSHYTAKIAERLDMECVFSLPYNEYKGEDGKIVFCPPEPHTHFKMFVQKLRESS